MTVYLLHFSKPYKHALHYIGWTTETNLEKRIQQHRDGEGSRLCQVAVSVGIELILARTWKGGRDKERQLKRAGRAADYCPICHQLNPDWWKARNKTNERRRDERRRAKNGDLPLRDQEGQPDSGPDSGT